MRGSQRAELSRYSGSVDWSGLGNAVGCDNKLPLCYDFVRTGTDIIMLLKSVKLPVNDAPWIKAEFRELIKACGKAFA